MQLIQQLLAFIISFVLSVVPMATYTEGMTGQPESFLPHQVQSQNDTAVSNLLYRGLFKYDIFGNLVPDLAESWEISSDGLTYKVTLKDNQYWSDGTKITSDDVIYTAFKLPDLQYVGTDKIDDRTVQFILPNKFSPFLSLLTSGIMKDQTEEESNPLTPVSSGDFRVLRVLYNGPIIKEVILFAKDPDSNIKKIVFRYYSNDEELITAAKLGEIDAFLSSSDDGLELENFQDKKFPQQGVYFALFFNLNDDALQDQALRQKLEQVINKEQLIYDKGILVEGPISRSLYTDQALEFNVYDPDLKEDLELDFTVTIPDLKPHRDIAERIKSIWKDRLDVNLEIVTKDPETFVQDVIVPRDFQMLIFGQEISRDPGRYINWHSTQKEHPGLNLSGFEQVRADRALEEGRNELDNDARVVHYNEFQKVLVEQVPAIFLYHPYKNFYVSKYIEGIGEKYTFTVEDRFLDFSNWKRIRTN